MGTIPPGHLNYILCSTAGFVNSNNPESERDICGVFPSTFSNTLLFLFFFNLLSLHFSQLVLAEIQHGKKQT